MISLVISGGQTGADLAGWKAARACSIPTSGWMPRNFQTEAGPRPDFAELFNAREHTAPDYPARRRANLADSDVAIVFNKGAILSPGTKGLLGDRRHVDRPVLLIYIEPDWTLRPIGVEEIARWIRGTGARTLMLAGNRESSAPGIGAFVERTMIEVFKAVLAAQQEDDRP